MHPILLLKYGCDIRCGLQGCVGSQPGGLVDFGIGLYALAGHIEALNILTNELVVN